MTSFKSIRERAERRKGGAAGLAKLLEPVPPKERLRGLPDDRFLSEMARRVFSAGFVWSVIDAKWLGFEEAFLGFSPQALLFQPMEFWEALTSDRRIVRNGQKIMSVKANAQFILDISREHGSFGAFLADWPSDDQLGLTTLLAKRGSRMGGNSGQMFLRFVGWDGYVLSTDVVSCLKDAGLEIAAPPTSKGDLSKVQAQFNAWAKESGLPYRHLSRIAAFSIGENYSAEQTGEEG
jgi:3-methyladenine DNA glycosylase Tag